MKFTIRKIVKYLLVPFGILYQLFYRNKNEIVILMYHRINNEVKKELAIKKDHFQWQMNYLKDKGYSVLSMEESYEKIKHNEIKGKHIVLTFDDGYRDYYEEAFPTLEKHGFPSVLYLVPGFIEKNEVYWWDKDVGKSDLLSWSQIEELGESSLIEFGSHTMNHRDLDTLEDLQLDYELQESKEILEKRLGKEIKHFSYPRGIYSRKAEEVINKIYHTGVLIFNGKEIRTSFDMKDRTVLKRIPIQRSDGKYLFVARVKGWLVAEEIFRKWTIKSLL